MYTGKRAIVFSEGSMKKRRTGLLWAAAVVLGAPLMRGSITYTCDPNIDGTQAGTCNYLNTTIAGLYGSTFSNANADIYIQMGTTGLGESNFNPTGVSYSTYRNALIATASSSPLDTAAIASLPPVEPSLYGGDDVFLTSALGAALDLTGMTGITALGVACTPGTSGCYDGIITITNAPILYWRQNGGTIPSSDYDFYSVVEHETDEVLGTSSCIDTTSGSLTNDCGGTSPSAVDLFRCSASTVHVFVDTTPGAYFSYNGCGTNGAGGAIYNTLANGEDYTDYVESCQFVQDAEGCPGSSLDITTDGNAEINVLDAIGYNLTASSGVPEPGTMALFGVGFAVLAVCRLRRRASL
jgi:PEP-CTERM motif-containing protein